MKGASDMRYLNVYSMLPLRRCRLMEPMAHRILP